MPRWSAWLNQAPQAKPNRAVDSSLANTVSVDNEVVASEVMTTEALRVAALAASARRGLSVTRRRIVLRWLAWLVWAWLLPIIGLATLLAALIALTSWQFVGDAVAYDAAQTWLEQQFGAAKTPKKAKQPARSDSSAPASVTKSTNSVQ